MSAPRALRLDTESMELLRLIRSTPMLPSVDTAFMSRVHCDHSILLAYGVTAFIPASDIR